MVVSGCCVAGVISLLWAATESLSHSGLVCGVLMRVCPWSSPVMEQRRLDRERDTLSSFRSMSEKVSCFVVGVVPLEFEL